MRTEPVGTLPAREPSHQLPAVLVRQIDAISSICEQNDVRALYVFGSAVHGTFEPATSDLDFQVDLGDELVGVARRYAGVYNGLSGLFDRNIDLITTRSRGNERFLREVARTRRTVYAS